MESETQKILGSVQSSGVTSAKARAERPVPSSAGRRRPPPRRLDRARAQDRSRSDDRSLGELHRGASVPASADGALAASLLLARGRRPATETPSRSRRRDGGQHRPATSLLRARLQIRLSLTQYGSGRGRWRPPSRRARRRTRSPPGCGQGIDDDWMTRNEACEVFAPGNRREPSLWIRRARARAPGTWRPGRNLARRDARRPPRQNPRATRRDCRETRIRIPRPSRSGSSSSTRASSRSESRLTLTKGLPLASGMGSSAASAVAGVVAAKHLLDLDVGLEVLLAAAMAGERLVAGSGHPDNAAACLYGGLVLARTANPPDVIQLPVPDGMSVAVVHPHVELSTRDSRILLGESVPLKKGGGSVGESGCARLRVVYSGLGANLSLARGPYR